MEQQRQSTFDKQQKTKAKSDPIALTVRQQSKEKAKSLPIIRVSSTTLTTQQRFYKRLLDKYRGPSLFVVILNIILVCEEIHPACLLEPINYYSDEGKAFIYTIPPIFKKIKPLVSTTDSIGCIFVFIKDSFVDKSIIEDPTRKDNC